MEIARKCTVVNFSITGEDGEGCFEGVDSFKYLERILYQVEEYWLEVIRDIQRSRQVC